MLQGLRVNQSTSTVGFCQISQNASPRIAIVIPARMDSQRLPGKALLEIKGLPMIEHVRRRGELNTSNVPVIVASGDEEILDFVSKIGAVSFQSKRNHENGTSRVFEFSQHHEYTHYLILQGDELLVLPEQIDALIRAVTDNPKIDFINLTTKLHSENEILDESVVKCVVDTSGKILYIFRKSPLIGQLSEQLNLLRKICGIFIISESALGTISNSEFTKLEKSQSIEQLRFLELGGSILSLDTAVNFPSINLPSDIEKVNSILNSNSAQLQILEQILS